MATYDMTSIDTAGVGANSIAVPTNVVTLYGLLKQS